MGDVHQGISHVGTLTARNVAVGEGARVVDRSDGALPALLGDLRAALADFQGPPDVAAGVRTVGEAVVADLEAPAPDVDRATKRLRVLREVAGSTGAVATAATALLGALGQVL